jgi:hypothetical protein
MRKTAPSALARAAVPWEDIQSQRKLAPGVFWFDCAGHGGAIAVIGVADLPTRAVDAARELGMLATVAIVSGPRRRTYSTTRGYSSDQLRTLAASHPDQVELADVWIGEEDCDWSTLALASEPMRKGMVETGGYGAEMTPERLRQAAFECAQRWNERFLAAFCPGYEPLADGPIAREDQRARLLEDGGPLRTWAEGPRDSNKIGDGEVLVGFRDQAGNETVYRMARDTYRAIPLDDHTTPESYAAHGEIARVNRSGEPEITPVRQPAH